MYEEENSNGGKPRKKIEASIHQRSQVRSNKQILSEIAKAVQSINGDKRKKKEKRTP